MLFRPRMKRRKVSALLLPAKVEACTTPRRLLRAPIMVKETPLESTSSIFMPGLIQSRDGACHMLNEVSSM